MPHFQVTDEIETSAQSSFIPPVVVAPVPVVRAPFLSGFSVAIYVVGALVLLYVFIKLSMSNSNDENQSRVDYSA